MIVLTEVSLRSRRQHSCGHPTSTEARIWIHDRDGPARSGEVPRTREADDAAAYDDHRFAPQIVRDLGKVVLHTLIVESSIGCNVRLIVCPLLHSGQRRPSRQR